ncbi:hypothetical protein BGW80DRAFT_866397 [Lactifluus volemus]|nr:hypothetical protein BGW80DRAFT_866397 [Lactifluus volemus]
MERHPPSHRLPAAFPSTHSSSLVNSAAVILFHLELIHCAPGGAPPFCLHSRYATFMLPFRRSSTSLHGCLCFCVTKLKSYEAVVLCTLHRSGYGYIEHAHGWQRLPQFISCLCRRWRKRKRVIIRRKIHTPATVTGPLSFNVTLPPFQYYLPHFLLLSIIF